MINRTSFVLTSFILTSFVLTSFSEAAVKAFPTAEGFGTDTVGGRGGIICKVTNLNDSGAGSFRGCAEMTVPRIIIFNVSGTIKLESDIVLRNAQSFVTIAGQTAPGDGVQIQGGDLVLRDSGLGTPMVHDVVIRHMRFRNGTIYTEKNPLPPPLPDGTRYANGRDTYSLLAWTGFDNYVFDHLDIEWGLDQTFSTNCSGLAGQCRGTIQWSIIAEAEASGNLFGPLMGGEDALMGSHTMHHNLIAHLGSRTPTNQPYTNVGNPDYATNWDFRNNVIYDFGSNQYPKCVTVFHSESEYNDWRDSGRVANRVNVVGNRLIRGINSLDFTSGVFHIGHFCRVYLNDNWAGGAAGPVNGFAAGVDMTNGIGVPWSDPDSGNGYEGGHYDPTNLPSSGFNAVQTTEFPFPAVTTHPASAIRDIVLANVGATKPKVDAVTARIRDSVVAGTGGFGRGTCDEAVFPQTVFGFIFNDFPCSYPTLNSTAPPADSDNDGMPNAWESSHGLNPNSASDGPAVSSNGYTNIENYINELAGDPIPGGGTTPPSRCDLNADTLINAVDVQNLSTAILSGSTNASFDINRDTKVNVLDAQILANVILGTGACPP